ncbi:MAG: hypothetical protein P9L99_02385 [Candidatus Lernaella stagnicola]|nr:hypothetical protein [Candidatus Lernaella stagnicola]
MPDGVTTSTRKAGRRPVVFVVVVVIVSILGALIIGEANIGHADKDWKLIGGLLYYQVIDPSVHEVVDDPRLLFRLRPGSQTPDGRVHVNSLGYRGHEVAVEKPADTFRIIVLGGSNVYGVNVTDEQSWPAQLERELNEGQGGFEVWNGGVPAYVGSQSARQAEIALETFEPDLLILALTNTGAPAFLHGAPFAPFFEKYPEFWDLLFFEPASFLGFADLPKLRRTLLRKSRFYRFYYAGMMSRRGLDWTKNKEFENTNVAAIHRLARAARQADVGVCFFLFPGRPASVKARYTAGLGVPVFHLSAEGMTEEFAAIHPPPRVMRWYGHEIAKFLRAEALVGP